MNSRWWSVIDSKLNASQLCGILNLNKPSGITSREAVNQVQRLVRPAKIGHTGTLDPLASGVLVLCLGTATRLVEYVQRMPKTYYATFLLGRHSDTEDIEGHVTVLPDPPIPTLQQAEAVLANFQGTILQRPPVYSALKIRGRRACDLARQGKPVELAARSITIEELKIRNYNYPQLTLDIKCGSGTYVRSLGRDIGSALGTAAVMSSLERTAVGCFDITQAEILEQLKHSDIVNKLLPATSAVNLLEKITLTETQQERIARGMSIEQPPGISDTEVAALNTNGQLVAILSKRGDGLGPLKNFL
jgi:tRNA pseudouridine55 synthase